MFYFFYLRYVPLFRFYFWGLSQLFFKLFLFFTQFWGFLFKQKRIRYFISLMTWRIWTTRKTFPFLFVLRRWTRWFFTMFFFLCWSIRLITWTGRILRIILMIIFPFIRILWWIMRFNFAFMKRIFTLVAEKSIFFFLFCDFLHIINYVDISLVVVTLVAIHGILVIYRVLI